MGVEYLVPYLNAKYVYQRHTQGVVDSVRMPPTATTTMICDNKNMMIILLMWIKMIQLINLQEIPIRLHTGLHAPLHQKLQKLQTPLLWLQWKNKYLNLTVKDDAVHYHMVTDKMGLQYAPDCAHAVTSKDLNATPSDLVPVIDNIHLSTSTEAYCPVIISSIKSKNKMQKNEIFKDDTKHNWIYNNTNKKESAEVKKE